MVIRVLAPDPGPELYPDTHNPMRIPTLLQEMLAFNFGLRNINKKTFIKSQRSEGGGEGWEEAWLNRLEGAGHSCLKNWLGN